MRNAHGTIYVGIDVSKDKLAVAIVVESEGAKFSALARSRAHPPASTSY